MNRLLKCDEFAIADDGYGDIRCIQPPGHTHGLHRKLAHQRAIHEKFNERLKNSNVLSQKFRHARMLHDICFFAVLNITKIMVKTEPVSKSDN